MGIWELSVLLFKKLKNFNNRQKYPRNNNNLLNLFVCGTCAWPISGHVNNYLHIFLTYFDEVKMYVAFNINIMALLQNSAIYVASNVLLLHVL